MTPENASCLSRQVSPREETLTLRIKCHGFESQVLHLIAEV